MKFHPPAMKCPARTSAPRRWWCNTHGKSEVVWPAKLRTAEPVLPWPKTHSFIESIESNNTSHRGHGEPEKSAHPPPSPAGGEVPKNYAIVDLRVSITLSTRLWGRGRERRCFLWLNRSKGGDVSGQRLTKVFGGFTAVNSVSFE